MQFTNEEIDIFWNAVQTRNRGWDGRVFYGVKTTGIFCRPSCPAKRPDRSSVEFFLSAKDAEKAGFRACKRCHPDHFEVGDNQVEYLRMISLLENYAYEITTVQKWVEFSLLTPSRLRKIIKEFTGISPREYLIKKKMDDFKLGIHTGEDVTSSQFSAGFGSSSRLYEKADSHLGMTPGMYKKGGAGVKIVFVILETPLGKLLVAATKRGVCSIQFGESENKLIDTLKREYPHAEINPHTGELTAWVAKLDQYFSGISTEFNIPMDLHATAFQLQVWHELRKIPFGETKSYSQVAEAIGKPKAARAVAAACAANPVAVLTPCHRVIHNDGSISGYRWGLGRKMALLNLEKRVSK